MKQIRLTLAWGETGTQPAPPAPMPPDPAVEPDPVLASAQPTLGASAATNVGLFRRLLSRVFSPRHVAVITRGAKTIAAGLVAAVAAYQGNVVDLLADPRALLTVVGAGVVLAAQKFTSWTDAGGS